MSQTLILGAARDAKLTELWVLLFCCSAALLLIIGMCRLAHCGHCLLCWIPV